MPRTFESANDTANCIITLMQAVSSVSCMPTKLEKNRAFERTLAFGDIVSGIGLGHDGRYDKARFTNLQVWRLLRSARYLSYLGNVRFDSCERVEDHSSRSMFCRYEGFSHRRRRVCRKQIDQGAAGARRYRDRV